MPGRPCFPEAGAATDPASARVNGHRHHFGRGMDQPDLRFSPGVSPRRSRVALHALVTRRATFYGFDPQRVSFQPQWAPVSIPRCRQTSAIHAVARPVQPSGSSAFSRPIRCARAPLAAALNCCSNTSMLETVRSPLQGRQPSGIVLMSHSVLGCFKRYPAGRTLPPVACQSPSERSGKSGEGHGMTGDRVRL